jgi:hypothetical protein
MEQEDQHFFDKKKNIKGVIYTFFALCGLLFLADFIVHRHVYHSWEQVPAFYAIFGFVAYVLIVFSASVLRRIVMRKEDYYEPVGGPKEDGDD